MNQQLLTILEPTINEFADATPTLPGISAIFQHDACSPLDSPAISPDADIG
jgi:hypothetical protein